MATTAFAEAPPQPANAYDHAVRFLPSQKSAYVLNDTITPHWRAGGADRFTYRKDLGDGRSAFVEVDAATGKRKPAFPADTVAKGLSVGAPKPVEADKLPFADYDEVGADAIRFDALGKTWTCSVVKPACDSVPTPTPVPTEAASPDGKWFAYVEDGNIWIRSADGKTRTALTHDAAPHYGYGAESEGFRGYMAASGVATPKSKTTFAYQTPPPSFPMPPTLIWSPDSRRIFTHRIDERAVLDLSITQWAPTDGSLRPITWTWKSAMALDPALPLMEYWILDIDGQGARKAEVAPVPDMLFSSIASGEAWWSPDSSKVYLTARTRYAKSKSLDVIDAATGAAKRLIEETGKTFEEFGEMGEQPKVRILANGDVIWFSERTGYGHLYLYDGETGQLKRALTQGEWTVRDIIDLNEQRGDIIIAANELVPGADPYYRTIASVRLSDGKLTRLTTEDADHDVRWAQGSAMLERPSPVARHPGESRGFSPSGRYFVDSFSRTDLATKMVLRRADGKLIADVDQADISRVKAMLPILPERFTVLAADGKTKLYGNIIRPSTFDPAKRYPIVDSIYPGPQSHRSIPDLVGDVFDRSMGQAFAELGMIVITVDGRGTHGRSKAFHDESYAGLSQAGHLDDHVAAIRQLAARYAYIDLDRVGIYGGSGGGYATTHAMFTFPDFFKVGIADAGNHDQRGYLAAWGETYNGPEKDRNYLDAANEALAANLKGKLLLMHGDMDTNVLPLHTLQVVNALIKANKNFDMLIVPNAGHTAMLGSPYAIRRAWDYFTVNLIHAEPPQDFDLSKIKYR
jgi:dipeptidyl aminopeptidase/acylaminoacyl peptidase